ERQLTHRAESVLPQPPEIRQAVTEIAQAVGKSEFRGREVAARNIDRLDDSTSGNRRGYHLVRRKVHCDRVWIDQARNRDRLAASDYDGRHRIVFSQVLGKDRNRWKSEPVQKLLHLKRRNIDTCAAIRVALVAVHAHLAE